MRSGDWSSDVCSSGLLWSRHIGSMAGVNVPIYAAEYMYVTTKEMVEVPRALPILRDPEGYIYAKEDAGRLLIGAFERKAKVGRASCRGRLCQYGSNLEVEVTYKKKNVN